eukprot:scaffold76682_cov82-Cyclotella_meneghiniana.AAC.4
MLANLYCSRQAGVAGADLCLPELSCSTSLDITRILSRKGKTHTYFDIGRVHLHGGADRAVAQDRSARSNFGVGREQGVKMM